MEEVGVIWGKQLFGLLILMPLFVPPIVLGIMAWHQLIGLWGTKLSVAAEPLPLGHAGSVHRDAGRSGYSGIASGRSCSRPGSLSCNRFLASNPAIGIPESSDRDVSITLL